MQDLPKTWSKDEFKKASISMIYQDPRCIIDAPEYLQDDDEVFQICIDEYPELIRYASDRLKDDDKFVLRALKVDRGSYLGDYMMPTRVPLKFVSERLKNDQKMILEAVKTNHHNLPYSDASLLKDKEFLLKCMAMNGQCWDYSNNFQNDKDICLAAVTQNGLVIERIPIDLMIDEEIALAAVKSNGYAYAIICDKANCPYFLKTMEFNMAAVLSCPSMVGDYRLTMRSNKEIAFAALQINGYLLSYYSNDETINDDEELVRVAVRQNGLALEFASKRLRRNRSVVFDAVKKNGDSLKYSIGFENDIVIILLAEKMYFKLICDQKMERLFDINFGYI